MLIMLAVATGCVFIAAKTFVWVLWPLWREALAFYALFRIILVYTPVLEAGYEVLFGLLMEHYAAGVTLVEFGVRGVNVTTQLIGTALS